MYAHYLGSFPDLRALPIGQMSTYGVVYIQIPTQATLTPCNPKIISSRSHLRQSHSHLLRVTLPGQLCHNINLVHIPILQISLPDKTLGRPRIFIPRALTNIAPILLIEHIKVRPVRTGVRVRPNRQRSGRERAASHGRVHAIGSTVDDCAPGSDARRAGGQGRDGFNVGVWLLVDEEAEGVCDGGVCEDGDGGGGDAFCPLAVRNIWGSRVVFVGGIVDVVPQFELTVRIQGPQLSRCVGFQPIRGHSSVTVGVIVESG